MVNYVGPYQIAQIQGGETVARVSNSGSLAVSINNGLAQAESQAADTAREYTDAEVSQDRARMDEIEATDQAQDSRLSGIESDQEQHEGRLGDLETTDDQHGQRLESIEAVDAGQDQRMESIEAQDQVQDERLEDIEAKDVLLGEEHRSPKTGIADTFRVIDSEGRQAWGINGQGDTLIGQTVFAESDGFRVRDTHGRTALEVTGSGDSLIGATRFVESDGFRVMDRRGYMAIEVDSDGRTHIYDRDDNGGGEGSAITTLHVFVAAGQSNMSGRGLPLEGPQSPRIMQFGFNRRVIEQAPLRLDMNDSPSGTSPALFFAENYLASQPDHVGVLLVPTARGGTGFGVGSSGYTWTPGAGVEPGFALYEQSLAQTQEALEAAKDQGYYTILKGVLWHQGENNGGRATEVYAGNLDELIAHYREDLDHPTLPFMVGQMCPEGLVDTPSKLTVDTAHQDTPYRTPFTGFAPAPWDGHNPGDTTHFSTAGTTQLGDTYLTGYTQALGNTKRGGN